MFSRYGLGIGGKVRRNVEARSSLPIYRFNGLADPLLLMPKSTGLTINCNFVRIEDFLL